MCSYHIIHVKDDRFIGHGLNLSWKGKRPPPSTFSGRQDLHTSLKSQGHTADRRSGGQASAGGTEAAHSLPPPPYHRAGEITAEQASKASKMSQRSRKLSEMSQSHYRKGRENMKLRSTQGQSERWTTPKKTTKLCEQEVYSLN